MDLINKILKIVLKYLGIIKNKFSNPHITKNIKPKNIEDIKKYTFKNKEN